MCSIGLIKLRAGWKKNKNKNKKQKTKNKMEMSYIAMSRVKEREGFLSQCMEVVQNSNF